MTENPSEPIGLNLGCGRRRLPGHLGVDSRPGPAVDIVHDLATYPWPFGDNSANSVVAWHILEHLTSRELVLAMQEIHRILVPHGFLQIRVPYKESPLYNPHHQRSFDRRTFDWWIVNGRNDGKSLEFAPYFERQRQEVVSVAGFPTWHVARYLRFTKGVLFQEDERGAYSRVLPGRVRELRESLVKT